MNSYQKELFYDVVIWLFVLGSMAMVGASIAFNFMVQ